MKLKNIHKNWWGQRKLQINKNYTPSYSPGYGKFENLLFRFHSPNGECVCVFVYNAVDVNKIATASLTKPPP